jgi:hypothetical protein
MEGGRFENYIEKVKRARTNEVPNPKLQIPNPN